MAQYSAFCVAQTSQKLGHPWSTVFTLKMGLGWREGGTKDLTRVRTAAQKKDLYTPRTFKITEAQLASHIKGVLMNQMRRG